MFLDRLKSINKLEKFDISNLFLRIYKQIYILTISTIFACSQSFYSSLLFILLIPFNHFCYKIHIEKNSSLKEFLKNDMEGRLYLKFRERYLFYLLTIISFIFLLMKIIFEIVTNFFPHRISSTEKELVSIFENILIFGFKNNKLDLGIHFLIFFMSFFANFISKKNKVYFDYYTVKIYQKFFGVFRYIILIILFFVLTFKKIVLSNSSILGYFENIIIIVYFCDFFIRFKTGNYKILHKYIRLLKYVAIIKFIIIFGLITLYNFFRTDGLKWDSYLLITNEITDFNSNDQLGIQSLICLYIFYNYFNFVSKFEDCLPIASKKIKYKELKNHPYKLFFIKHFAKNLLKILQITDYKKALKSNYDLNYDFYKDLKNFNYFKITFEYNLKGVLAGEKMPKRFALYEIYKKYATIIHIYKYDFFKYSLNIIMLSVLLYFFKDINIFSLFYFCLAIIIMVYPEFKVIWNSSLMFCVLPNLITILFNLTTFILKFVKPELSKILINKASLVFPQITDQNASQIHSFVFVINIVYLFLQYKIYLKMKKNTNVPIVQHLRTRRMTVLEADEDLLFIIKSILGLTLIVLKYYFFYIILKESLTYISIINLFVVVMIIAYFVIKSDLMYDIFINICLAIFVLKYLSKFRLLFTPLEAHYYLMYGLYFNDYNFSNTNNYEDIQIMQFDNLVSNFFLLFILFFIKQLLDKLKDEKFIETRIFKTKYFSEIYNYLIELIFHCKNAIDSTKIYLVYFIIFYYAIKKEKNLIDFCEYGFTAFMLTFHMFLYKKKGHMKNHFFLFFFFIYFFVLLTFFFIKYKESFEYYLANNLTEKERIDDLSVFYKENWEKLFPLILKLILTIISLKSILQESSQNQNENATTSQIENLSKKNLKTKLYYKIFKIFSVFVKEGALFCTFFAFLGSPNFFGILYLSSYLYYFLIQIRSLLKIITKFKFDEIVKLKIDYYNSYLLNQNSVIKNDITNLYDKKYEDLGIYYFYFFSKRIFNSIHKKVNKNWTWNFIIVLSYMTIIFMISFGEISDDNEFEFLRFFLFNFKSYKFSYLQNIFLRLTGVLFVTVIEIYFIKVLKTEKLDEESDKAKLVINIIRLRYQAMNLRAKNYKNPMSEKEIKLSQNIEKLLKYVKNIDLSEEINIEKFKFLDEEDKAIKENTQFITNLNKKIEKREKSLLLIRNRGKLSYLKIINGFLFVIKKLILIPIILGVLYSLNASPFTLVAFVLLYINYSKRTFEKTINLLNIVLAIVCLFEYVLLFLSEILTKSTDKQINFFIQNYIEKLKEQPISGLGYMFIYASLFKVFFMTLIYLCYNGFTLIDQVEGSFLSKINKFSKNNENYFIVDYKYWGHSVYSKYFRIKNHIVLNIGNMFFIISLLFYFSSMGVLELISTAIFFYLKFYFSFVIKKQFTDFYCQEYQYYYKIIAIANWTIFFFSQFNDFFSYSFEIHEKFLFSLTLTLNMAIIEACDKKGLKIEYEKMRNFYAVKNKLETYSYIYNYNEQQVLENARSFVVSQFLENKYQNNDHSQETTTRKRTLSNFSINFKQTDLNQLTVFAKANKYKEYLYRELGIFNSTILRIKLLLRTKLFLSNSISNNYLSLINNFVEKNKNYAKDNNIFNLFKLINGDIREIDLLIQQIEQNNTLFMNEESLKILNNKVRKYEKKINKKRLRRTIATPKLRKNCKSMLTEMAVNVLFKKLITDDQSDIIRQKKCGTFFDNTFKHFVDKENYMIIRNYDEINSKLNDYKFVNFGVKEYFYAIVNLINLKAEFIMNILLICILCFNQGFFSSILIFVLVYFVLIENKVVNLTMWQISYLLFMLIYILQQMFICQYKIITYEEIDSNSYKENLPSYNMACFLNFFYGKIDNFVAMIIFICYELLIIKMSKYSMLNKNISEIENPSQCIFRISFNDDWQKVYNRKNNLAMCDINMIEDQIKIIKKKKLKDKEYMIFIISLIKKKTEIYKEFKEKFITFLELICHLIPLYNRDKNEFKSKNFKSYFWRNFNCFLRKPGRNYHNYLLFFLLTILIYFTIFYYNLLGINKSIWKSIENNDIQGTLGVNFSLIFLAICVERFFYSKYSFKWVESTKTQKDQVISILKSKDIKPSRLKINRYKTLDKVKQCMKKLTISKFLIEKSKVNIRDHYKHNPMLKKFIFSIIFWLYMTFLIFFWFPMRGHSQKASESQYSNTLFCNNTYVVSDDRNGHISKCNNFSNNGYLQFLFFLVNVYVIISIIQIKKGFSSLDYINHVDYNNIFEVLYFYIYKYTPFIRELKTILDFSASTTALNIFMWFKQEDIETTIKYARVNELSNQYHGTKMDKAYKRLTGFSFLIFFFLLLMAPLYLFSDILPNNVKNQIKGAHMVVFAEFPNSTFKIFENKEIINRHLSNMSNEYKLIKNNDHYKKYGVDLFWKLVFNKKSQFYFDITKESINFVRETFESKRKVSINIYLTIETEHKGKKTKRFTYNLNEENGPIFVNMLTNKECSKEANNRILLGVESKLIDLKNLLGKEEEEDVKDNRMFEFIFLLKFVCDPASNKISFEISDDNYDNIEFVILNENIKNSVEILEKISKSTVSIMSIYVIIFSYIGITIIRKAFFEQAHRIWTTEIPNAHKLEEYVYLILYARIKGDLYTEEIFYNQLIDLFREPEKIKRLTGPIINPNLYKNK